MPTPTSLAFRRYIVITAIATPANVAVIALGLALTSWSSLVCNLVAATTVALPTYVACRRWVWRVADHQPGRGLAFLLSSLVNVVVSSTAVWVVAARGAPEALVVVTPLLVYTSTWVLRFLVLDRLVFRPRRGPVPDHVDDVTVAPVPTTP